MKETPVKISVGAKPLVFPTPVFIVGTYDVAGKPNAMAVAWGGICNSKPASVCISVREATYTYGALVERKAFTISIPSEEHMAIADYFGVASGRDEDKFAVAGVTPLRSELVDAPYVAEFPWALECRVLDYAKLGLHTHFIGEILDVKVDESCLDEGGRPDLDRLKPFGWSPANGHYYATGRDLGRGFHEGKAFKKDA